MRNITKTLAVLGLAAGSTLSAIQAYATPSSITFVADGGSDVGACGTTVAAPCRQISWALGQTGAGGTIIVAKGNYGSFEITKAITIIGEIGATINGGGGTDDGSGAFYAIVVKVGASETVRIAGLKSDQFSSPSFGNVSFIAGKALIIENCILSGSGSSGSALRIVPGTAAAGGAPTSVIVRDSAVGPNAAGAITIAPPNGVAVAAQFDNVTVLGSTFGIKADNTASGKIKVNVKNSVSRDNSTNGFIAVGNGANPIDFMIDKSTAENNAAFGEVATGAQAFMIVTDSTLSANGTGLAQLSSATVASTGTNTINFNTTNTSGTITPISLK